MARTKRTTSPETSAALLSAITADEDALAFFDAVTTATPTEAVAVDDQNGRTRFITPGDLIAALDDSANRTFDLYGLICSETDDNQSATADEVAQIIKRLNDPATLPGGAEPSARSIAALGTDGEEYFDHGDLNAAADNDRARTHVLVLPSVLGLAVVLDLKAGAIYVGCETIDLADTDGNTLASLVNDNDDGWASDAAPEFLKSDFGAGIALAVVRAKRDAWLAAQPKPKRTRKRAAKKSTKRARRR
jgi:hypothetical protein